MITSSEGVFKKINIILTLIGGRNGAVIASFLGKASILSSGSEVMGLKPSPLIKLIYHRNHLRTHELSNKHKLNAPSGHRKIRILRIKSAATTKSP
jgi:hypothetical protein